MSNPVAKIEQFMVDALVSSPLIPIGVNVMRLADTIDKEGVVQSSSNIIVSYSGGSSNIKNREPLVFEKSYIFKITFNCQDYLNTSAHDFALHLVDAATRSLSNQVPFVDGVQVIEPFYSSDETFEGITENSQYVYSQTWRLLSEELYPNVSMDPCVRRGNCKAVWPPVGYVSEIPPGSVITDDGRVWEIACEDDDGNIVLGSYYNNDGDLVLKCDDSILIPKEELNKWKLTTTGFITTEDGKLEVWLVDEDGNQIEQIFFTNEGKKVTQGAYGLYRSATDNFFRNSLDVNFKRTPLIARSTTYAVVNVVYTRVYTNPLISDEGTDVFGGKLLLVDPATRLNVDGINYIYVAQSDLGSSGWVDERAVTVQDREEIYPASNLQNEQNLGLFDNTLE